MTTEIKRRRGTTAQHATFTGALAELTVDTDKNVVVVHDGATAGGFPLATEADSVPAGGTEGQVLAIADGERAWADPVSIAEGVFTPTISFATPGTLSVAYSRQFGRYTRVGDRVFINIDINFTPTFTGASGNFLINGAPYAALDEGSGYLLSIGTTANINYGSGKDAIAARISANTSQIVLIGSVSSGIGAVLTSAQFTSGTAYSMLIEGGYVAS